MNGVPRIHLAKLFTAMALLVLMVGALAHPSVSYAQQEQATSNQADFWDFGWIKDIWPFGDVSDDTDEINDTTFEDFEITENDIEPDIPESEGAEYIDADIVFSSFNFGFIIDVVSNMNIIEGVLDMFQLQTEDEYNEENEPIDEGEFDIESIPGPEDLGEGNNMDEKLLREADRWDGMDPYDLAEFELEEMSRQMRGFDSMYEYEEEIEKELEEEREKNKCTVRRSEWANIIAMPNERTESEDGRVVNITFARCPEKSEESFKRFIDSGIIDFVSGVCPGAEGEVEAFGGYGGVCTARIELY